MSRLLGLFSRRWLVALAAGLLFVGSVACGESVNGKGRPESEVGTFQQQVEANTAAANLPSATAPALPNDPEPTPTPITKGLPNPALPNNNPALPTPTPVPGTPPSVFVPPLNSGPLGSLVDPAILPGLLAQALQNSSVRMTGAGSNGPVGDGNPVDPASLPTLLASKGGTQVTSSNAVSGPSGAGNPVDPASLPALLAGGSKAGVGPALRPGDAASVASPSAQQALALNAPVGPAIAAPAASFNCGSLSSARARDWCTNPTDVFLTCADFPAGTGEATRFTRERDPDDTNGLDKDGDGRSCSDR